MVSVLRNKILTEEFDYQILLDSLKKYKYPRDKIKKLLKSGDIIRIKKGIYIFGEKYRRNPFSREVLANMIYGPSYISLEYALSYYGLIPERIETVTSVTMKYNKRFSTPVGLFIYKHIPSYAYPYGIDILEIGLNRSFLIAEAEKALIDKVYIDKNISLRSLKETKKYLFEDLRIDINQFKLLNSQKLKLYAEVYKLKKLSFIYKLLN